MQNLGLLNELTILYIYASVLVRAMEKEKPEPALSLYDQPLSELVHFDNDGVLIATPIKQPIDPANVDSEKSAEIEKINRNIEQLGQLSVIQMALREEADILLHPAPKVSEAPQRLFYRDENPHFAPSNTLERRQARRAEKHISKAFDAKRYANMKIRVWGEDIGTQDFVDRIKNTRGMSFTEKRQALKAHRKYLNTVRRREAHRRKVEDIAKGNDAPGRRVKRRINRTVERIDRLQAPFITNPGDNDETRRKSSRRIIDSVTAGARMARTGARGFAKGALRFSDVMWNKLSDMFTQRGIDKAARASGRKLSKISRYRSEYGFIGLPIHETIPEGDWKTVAVDGKKYRFPSRPSKRQGNTTNANREPNNQPLDKRNRGPARTRVGEKLQNRLKKYHEQQEENRKGII